MDGVGRVEEREEEAGRLRDDESKCVVSPDADFGRRFGVG